MNLCWSSWKTCTKRRLKYRPRLIDKSVVEGIKMLQSRPKIHKDEEKDTSSCKSIRLEDVPLEFHVLLCACRVFLGTEEPARLEEILGRGPDWDKLLALAIRHGVMPLLYKSFGRVDRQLVPQEAMARLRVMYMQNTAKNIRMTSELLKILDALKDAGIKAVPLKGPVLAEQLYGDVALRQFSDLDILVKRVDADKALRVFEKKDYIYSSSNDPDPRKEKSRKKRAAMLEHMYHYELTNERLGMHAELHWQLSPSFRRLNVDESAIWDRIKTDGLSGKEVLSLSSEDYLIFLCQHGAMHLWKRLSWLCDISALLTINNISHSSALKTANEVKNERILLLGFLLAQRLMKVSIPEEIDLRAETDEQLINLFDEIVSNIVSTEDNTNSSSQRLSDLMIYNNVFSFKEKAAFYANLFMTPTKPDFDLLSLPDILFPAYKLIRPFRLMKDYGEAFKKQPEEQRKAK